jgi:hypothetical protein
LVIGVSAIVPVASGRGRLAQGEPDDQEQRERDAEF